METSYCIICNSINKIKFLKIHDRLKITADLFELKKCECGFIFLDPRPTIDEIGEYYDDPSYDPHNVEGKSTWSKLFKNIQTLTSYWKKNIILNYVRGKKILDIGGGESIFPHIMNKEGWDVTVQDKYFPFKKIREFSTVNDLNDLNFSNQFDVITLWHSLEHIHDIKDLFGNISKLISKNGILIIAVPNFNAYERKVYGVYWAPYDAPRHLYHFTPNSLNSLLNKYGFHVIRKKGLIQDTFYNIFLSMQYSIKGVLMALYVLFKILFLALLFGPTNSSSFLFVCKRK